MGLIVMATLCVSFSFLLMPSASSHALEQSSHLQATEAVGSPRLVPGRKFRLLNEARESVEVKAQGFPVTKQNDNKKENVSGQPYKREQNVVNLSRGGKGRKSVDVADMSSRFFTMDYPHIRRRGPVHNMSLRRP